MSQTRCQCLLHPPLGCIQGKWEFVKQPRASPCSQTGQCHSAPPHSPTTELQSPWLMCSEVSGLWVWDPGVITSIVLSQLSPHSPAQHFVSPRKRFQPPLPTQPPEGCPQPELPGRGCCPHPAPLPAQLWVCWEPSPAAVMVMQGRSLTECQFCMLKIESDRLAPCA